MAGTERPRQRPSFVFVQTIHYGINFIVNPRDAAGAVKPYWQRVLAAFAIGMMVEVVVAMAHAAGYLGRLENIGADLFMGLYQNVGISDKSIPFVFIDIDQKTYERWGSPPWVPRDALQCLVEEALAWRPNVLIVDVDLGFPSCDDSDNRAIIDYVMKKENSSTILLQGLTIPSLNLSSKKTTNGSQYYYPRCENLLEQYSQSEHVHWAFPAALAGSDLVVREWKLATPLLLSGTSGDGDEGAEQDQSTGDRPRTHIQPGIGLISFAAMKCPDAGGDLSSACRSMAGSGSEATLQKLVDVVSPDRIDSRIVFTIPWDSGGDDDGPKVDDIPIVTRIAAADIYDEKECKPLSSIVAGRTGDLDKGGVEDAASISLSNSIVVIGGSYFDSRDQYLTPIGLMPGAMIMINGIHSLLTLGIVDEPRGWPNLAIAILTSLIGALISQLNVKVEQPILKESIKTMLNIIVVGGVLAILTYFALWHHLFGLHGLWVDATLPVVGIMVHRYVQAWRER